MNKEKICPLCGKPNECKAGTDEKCWCFDTPVPKALLERIPSEKRGKACVCQNCVEAYNKELGNNSET